MRSVLYCAAALCCLWAIDATLAAPVNFDEISRIEEARTSWVATDGRTLATGAGHRLYWGEVGPPMRLTQSLTLDVEIESGLLAGPRLIFTTADRRLGQLQLDQVPPAPHFFTLDPAPRGALRLTQESGRIVLGEKGRGLRSFRIQLAGHAHHGGMLQLIEELPPPSTQWPHAYAGNIASAGRWRFIAGGDRGLTMERSRGGGPQLFPVSVSNDFFTPMMLAVDVGDFVQWANASGFHNVDSCDAGELGCEGQIATESFRSGPPMDPLWIFSHQFMQSGVNRYVCESHAPFMWGSVEVATPPPPAVPDGISGPPMRVAKLEPSGELLQIAWDTGSCDGALDHQLLYGTEGGFPVVEGGLYELGGATCALGALSPIDWSLPPVLSRPGQRLLWWLIVATDGQGREGSWGKDGGGEERNGAGSGGSSVYCAIGGKTLVNRCGQ